MKIQICQQSHVEACVALALKSETWLQAYNREILGDAIWNTAMYNWQETTEAAVRRLFTDGRMFVGEICGELAAFGGYYQKDKIGTIARFAYDPALVGEDRAAELCQYILEDMKERGISYAVTDIKTEPVSGALLPVFTRVGFEKNLPHVCYYQTLGPRPELPPTQLQIVPAEEEHVDSCVTISQQLWSVIHQVYVDAIGEELHEVFSGNWRTVHKASISALLRSGNAFVALLEGKVVGFCGCRVENGVLGVISYNGVDPEQRGKGIARYMYEYAFSRLREQGISHVRVLTGGDPGHAPARRAYEKAGFDRALRSGTYYKIL